MCSFLPYERSIITANDLSSDCTYRYRPSNGLVVVLSGYEGSPGASRAVYVMVKHQLRKSSSKKIEIATALS
jgi:hypothetical protein